MSYTILQKKMNTRIFLSTFEEGGWESVKEKQKETVSRNEILKKWPELQKFSHELYRKFEARATILSELQDALNHPTKYSILWLTDTERDSVEVIMQSLIKVENPSPQKQVIGRGKFGLYNQKQEMTYFLWQLLKNPVVLNNFFSKSLDRQPLDPDKEKNISRLSRFLVAFSNHPDAKKYTTQIRTWLQFADQWDYEKLKKSVEWIITNYSSISIGAILSPDESEGLWMVLRQLWDTKNAGDIFIKEWQQTIQRAVEKNVVSPEQKALGEYLNNNMRTVSTNISMPIAEIQYNKLVQALPVNHPQRILLENDPKAKEKIAEAHAAIYCIDTFIKDQWDKGLWAAFWKYNDMKGLYGIDNWSDENIKMTKEMAIMVASFALTAGIWPLLGSLGVGARILQWTNLARATNLAQEGKVMRAGIATTKAKTAQWTAWTLEQTAQIGQTSTMARFGTEALKFTTLDAFIRNRVRAPGEVDWFDEFIKKLSTNFVMFWAFAGMEKVIGKLLPVWIAKAEWFQIQNGVKLLAFTSWDVAVMQALHAAETGNIEWDWMSAFQALAFRVGMKGTQKLPDIIAKQFPNLSTKWELAKFEAGEIRNGSLSPSKWYIEPLRSPETQIFQVESRKPAQLGNQHWVRETWSQEVVNASKTIKDVLNRDVFKSTLASPDGLIRIRIGELGFPDIVVVKYKNTGKSDKQYTFEWGSDKNFYSLSEIRAKIQQMQESAGIQFATQNISGQKKAYESTHPESILATPEILNIIDQGVKDNPLFVKAWWRYKELWWELYLHPESWISSSAIWWKLNWENTFINIWIGRGWEGLHMKMQELYKAFWIETEWHINTVFRHEIGHDITIRYLQNHPEVKNHLESKYQELMAWTISPMAMDWFYIGAWRNVQILEDFAEMMSLYIKKPEVFTSYMQQLKNATIDIPVKNFLNVFENTIYGSYREYINWSNQSINPSSKASNSIIWSKSEKLQWVNSHTISTSQEAIDTAINRVKSIPKWTGESKVELLGNEYTINRHTDGKQLDTVIDWKTRHFDTVESFISEIAHLSKKMEWNWITWGIEKKSNPILSSKGSIDSRLPVNGLKYVITKEVRWDIADSMKRGAEWDVSKRIQTGDTAKIREYDTIIKDTVLRVKQLDSIPEIKKALEMNIIWPRKPGTEVVDTIERETLRLRAEEIIQSKAPEIVRILSNPQALEEAVKDPINWKKWSLAGIIPWVLLLAYLANKDKDPSSWLTLPNDRDTTSSEAAANYCKKCYSGPSAVLDIKREIKINGKVNIADEKYRMWVSKRWMGWTQWKSLVPEYQAWHDSFENTDFKTTMDTILTNNFTSNDVRLLQHCIGMLDNGKSLDSKYSQDGMLGTNTTKAILDYMHTCVGETKKS